MVVLAGYKTVKEALVNHDEEFGDRDTFEILRDFTKGHGKENTLSKKNNNFKLKSNKVLIKKKLICISFLSYLRCFMGQWGLLERNATLCLDKPERLWNGQESM